MATALAVATNAARTANCETKSNIVAEDEGLTKDGLAVGWVSVRSVRGSNLGDGGVGQRGSVLGNWGDSLDGQRLTVDDGVESVDGVSVVLNSTTGAIGLDQRRRQEEQRPWPQQVSSQRSVVGSQRSVVGSERSMVSSQRRGMDGDGAGDGHDGIEYGEL
uniref:Uncharacterized protein n=1 Tax=Anopheles coluzzii TaxID=1518534 RepID=A0A8W7PAA7_ANOCL